MNYSHCCSILIQLLEYVIKCGRKSLVWLFIVPVRLKVFASVSHTPRVLGGLGRTSAPKQCTVGVPVLHKMPYT